MTTIKDGRTGLRQLEAGLAIGPGIVRDLVLLLVAGVVLYLASDRLLRLLEAMLGRPLADRQVAFLLIMLALGLPLFWLLRQLG